MNQISIIIPTLWKAPEKLCQMIKQYSNSPFVEEIILIDNAGEGRYASLPFDHLYPKLQELVCDENIFVNPAWNLGVEKSKSDIIALVNDDLLIDSLTLSVILQKAINTLTSTDIQLIGMAESNFSPTEKSGLLPTIKNITHKCYGFGTFMLMKKENYVPIPSDLKIWRGDHILLTHNHTAELGGVFIDTEMSETIKTDKKFSVLGRQDVQLYKLKYKNVTLPKYSA